MKHYCLLVILSLSLLACSCNSEVRSTNNTFSKKIRKQITAVAEQYITGQLGKPEKTISKSGMITLSDDKKKYIIEPSKIFIGFIDDDSKNDAIVSLSVIQGSYQTISEQLIILKSENNFVLARTIESDMRIISLKDRIITADVPEHSRNSPLFNCPSCWEVVKYQFKMGELVRVE